MPLYEIVLRFPDRDEIRLTDRNGYRTDEEILIAGRRFLVTGTESPERPSAEDRFVLEPCDDRDGRPLRADPVAGRSPRHRRAPASGAGGC